MQSTARAYGGDGYLMMCIFFLRAQASICFSAKNIIYPVHQPDADSVDRYVLIYKQHCSGSIRIVGFFFLQIDKFHYLNVMTLLLFHSVRVIYEAGRRFFCAYIRIENETKG